MVLVTSTKLLYVELEMGGIPPGCATSHLDQLSLLPSVGRKMSTGQGTVAVLCGWESNRPSLTGSVTATYRLNGPRNGDEHPAYTPEGVWY